MQLLKQKGGIQNTRDHVAWGALSSYICNSRFQVLERYNWWLN
jgi:hypothetical protein